MERILHFQDHDQFARIFEASNQINLATSLLSKAAHPRNIVDLDLGSVSRQIIVASDGTNINYDSNCGLPRHEANAFSSHLSGEGLVLSFLPFFFLALPQTSTASTRAQWLQWARPHVNSKWGQIAVGTAGPRQQAPDRSGHKHHSHKHNHNTHTTKQTTTNTQPQTDRQPQRTHTHTHTLTLVFC